MVVTMQRSQHRTFSGELLQSHFRVHILNRPEDTWGLMISPFEVESFRKALICANTSLPNEGDYMDFGSIMAERRLYRNKDGKLVVTTLRRGNRRTRFLKFMVEDPQRLVLKLTALMRTAQFKMTCERINNKRKKVEKSTSYTLAESQEERASLRNKRAIRAGQTIHRVK